MADEQLSESERGLRYIGETGAESVENSSETEALRRVRFDLKSCLFQLQSHLKGQRA